MSRKPACEWCGQKFAVESLVGDCPCLLEDDLDISHWDDDEEVDNNAPKWI